MKFWIVLGLMLLWAALFARSEQKLSLPEAATVPGAELRLCDLLPKDAPPQLRMAAAGIALGAAPQPGSLRIFTRQQLLASLPARMLQELSIPARVEVERQSWPISGNAIGRAVDEFLAARGQAFAPLAYSSLSWPGRPVSLSENPVLEVMGTAIDPRRRLLEFRLRCQNPAACGSFLAEMRLPQEQPPALPEPPRSFSRPSPRLLAVAEYAPARLKAATIRPPVEQPGDTATLVLESGGIRISLPAVCLQSGALGQTIRVRAAGGHHMFYGEVMGGGVLRAKF